MAWFHVERLDVLNDPIKAVLLKPFSCQGPQNEYELDFFCMYIELVLVASSVDLP